MITAEIKRRKGTKHQGMLRLSKYLNKLGRNKVEAGFFNEMGIHPSDKNTEQWTYAQLMAFHELQVEFTQKRPIFSEASKILVKSLPKEMKECLRRELVRASRGGSSSPLTFLDEGGKVMMETLDSIFGKAPPLAPNSRYTILKKGSNDPMIESGELKGALRYKNTVDKVVKS